MTSRDDPRIEEAINVAMAAAYSALGQDSAWADREVWGTVYPQGRGWAWCGGFVVWAYRHAGVDLMRCRWWFYTPNIANFAREIGAWKTDGGQYGDNVLFEWHGDGVIDHVGLSNPDWSSDLYRSIEGNTSRGTYGSQDNGGGVWERYRSWDDIAGWVDMRTVLAWMIDNGLWDGNVSGMEDDMTNDDRKMLHEAHYLVTHNLAWAIGAIDARSAALVNEVAALKAQNTSLAKTVGDLSKVVAALVEKMGG